MTQHSTHFTMSACALAVSLLVSACGGADPADSVPPTVAITDNVSVDPAKGPVTFTFTFSEDVGSSFALEDVTVTGGTAGTFTRVGPTLYTLVVTPPVNSSSTINVSVAAARFKDLALNDNTAAASAQQAYDTTVAVATEPTTAAPTPTALAANVLSIYSDAYTPVAGVVLRPDWGQSTQVSEVTIAGNKTQKYTAFNYEGITFTPIDISPMTKLHIDVWTPDLTALDVYVLAGGAEQFVKLTPTLAGWNSFDIDLSQYTTLDKTAVKELKLVSTGGSTLYSDNIYFWGSGGGSGACAAPDCVDFSAAGIGFGPFENGGGGTVEIAADPANAANKVVKFVKKAGDGDYFGTTITGLGVKPVLTADKKTVTMRVFSPAVGTNFLLKFEGGTGGPAVTEKDAVTTKANEWETLSFVMPDAGTYSTIVLFPHGRSAVSADTTMYIDDLAFPATVPAGGGGGGGFTGGIFASDYTGNLGLGTAKSDKGGTVGFFLDPRLFANKAFDDGSVCGSACNPGGVYNFYYGIGKLLPALTDAYFGGFVNAPGDTTADASAYAKVKLKFWGDAESWEKSNFTAQVDVLLQGPTNAACTNPSGRPEMVKAVTAQKIGAGSEYIIAKTDFVLTESCGGAYTVSSVWSAVGAVVVRLTGTNLQYVNTVPSVPVSYPTFINIGPISFIN